MKIFRRKDKLEYEFLPSALEIEETPPSPLGRLIIWTIFVLIVLFLTWSYLAKTDEVAVARGKIIPSGKVKVIEPMEEGIVKEILIQEGEKVKQGQLLIRLDPTINQSDVADLEKILAVLKIEYFLLSMNLKYKEQKDFTLLRDNPDYKKLSDTELNFHVKLQNSELTGYLERILTQQHLIIQTKKEYQITQTQLAKLKKKYETLSNENRMLENLAKKGGVSKREWLNKNSEVETLEHEISIQETEVEKAASKREEAEHSLIIIKKQWITDNLSKMVEAEKKINSTKLQLVKAKKKLELQNLYSPVDGLINQMEVTTIGEVVEPAKAIITIVPDNILVAEVMVLNKDIGFIRNNQEAELKLDTFPFHKYGVIEGKVINISPDAVLNQATRELEYKVQIKPAANTISVDNRLVPITPGMSLTAEVKTGTRRIIEFFMDPISKFKNEGFKLR